VRPRARRKLARWAQEAYRISERHAARIVKLGISTLRYRSRKVFDEVLRRRLRELAGTYVRYGYRRLTVLLRREGWRVNAKRIYRLYREEELMVRTKQRRKTARRQRVHTNVATCTNQCWSMDFVSDKFADGRSFRILTVIDQFTRECVALEADRAMTGSKVAEALERARKQRDGLPESITVDNGSEFSGRALEAWAMANSVHLCFIRPGRPVENSFIESFNGRLRDECLNVEWFSSLEEAREKLAKFREHYNHQRPHSSLADRAPAVFAALHRREKEASPQVWAGEEAHTPPLPLQPHPAGTSAKRSGNFSLLLEALECAKPA
jgi:putative transposase